MSFSRAEEDRGDDAIVAEINVTPLTDVFLVLLIIFMVTSTALIEQGAPVNLPKAPTGGAVPSGVIVTVTADHQVSVDGKRVAMDALKPALADALRAARERNVVLRGDRQVVLEDAVHIMTTAKSAGAEKISIATEPEGARGR